MHAHLLRRASFVFFVGSAGCTANATVAPSPPANTCALDTTLACPSGGTGYQCTGSAAPDTMNQVCNTDGTGDFCCFSSACNPDPSVACAAGSYGYSCGGGQPPPDASDATLVCSIGVESGPLDEYCCATIQAATGASCAEDQSVSGCASGSYGFACTGGDRPDADYSGIVCSTAATLGTNAQGAPAMLYCCTFS